MLHAAAVRLLAALRLPTPPPVQMGTAIKTHLAQRIGRAAGELCVVSIMPCVRKQGEADRIMMQTDDGARPVLHHPALSLTLSPCLPKNCCTATLSCVVGAVAQGRCLPCTVPDAMGHAVR